MRAFYLRVLTLLLLWGAMIATGLSQPLSVGNLTGSFQTDFQYYFPDSLIGAQTVSEKTRTNAYLQLQYQHGPVTVGLRYELYLNPILGYDQRYEGQGIPFRFASYANDWLEITAGNFYEQFGSGMVLRSYWEYYLGIDNSIDGARVKVTPVPGLNLKLLIGKQRDFWTRSEGIVRGGDIEFYFNDLFKGLRNSRHRITIGGSLVSKYQQDDDPVLILPENVTASAARVRYQNGGFNFEGEFAYKVNDPHDLNRYVYNTGNSLFVQAAYTRKGFGITLQGKRVDNFDFRSDRDANLQQKTINYLPPITKFQTYRLPTLYPYATQPNGEIGYSANVFYNIPRKSALGGKYGTLIQVNFSQMNGLDTTFTDSVFIYESEILGDPDRLYYQNLSIEINRKWSRKFRSIISYDWIKYNKDIIEFGTENAGFGVVESHTVVFEGQYKVSRKHALRFELQHLYTQQDLGSWAMVLFEYSISPGWYFTFFDEYNYGNSDVGARQHYPSLQASYTFKTHRFSFGWARQRRGLLCVGGICREVPASNGLIFSMSSTF